jgi:hypothetical protein
MRGVAQGNTISPLTFTVVKEMVAKWIERECRGYEIAGIEVKGMDYMDDEVRITDTEAEIRKWRRSKASSPNGRECDSAFISVRTGPGNSYEGGGKTSNSTTSTYVVRQSRN